MKYTDLAILLTCHSLEDFPVHHTGSDANSLLANWTALWHPRLIAEAEKIPKWIQTFEVPENCEGYLFVAPTTSDTELQTGFAQRVKEEGGLLVRRKETREEIFEQVFAEHSEMELDSSLTADFLALGYCYLQIQLLTRQLRYSSNLDEVYFGKLVVDGAQALVDGNHELAKQKLQSSFDLLMEERDNYYPVNALLIDLTLVADSTLGESLCKQVEGAEHPFNLLVSGELAQQIAADDKLRSLCRSQLDAEKLFLVGGSQTESRFSRLSAEALISEFSVGQDSFQSAFNKTPQFYGRRRFGLCPFLPQILEHFGFDGAFHFTLDDGRFPEGMQLKSYWEGDGEARIEIFGKIPLDANEPGNFLNLGVKIGESFDMDHAAAICFVHWPAQNSVWFDDLQRISRYGSVLGKFVSANDFLQDMDEPYQHDRFTIDQYQDPFFKQSVIRNQANPISRSIDYWSRSAKLNSINALQFLRSIFAPHTKPTDFEIDQLTLVADYEATEPPNEQIDVTLDEHRQRLATELVEQLATEESETSSVVVLNPFSSVQRQSLMLESDLHPAVEKPVYAYSQIKRENQPQSHVVCDVPPLGFVQLSSASRQNAGATKANLIVDDMAMRNEFMEVIVDRTTGGIRAVHDYKTRGNRLSQILSCRAKTDSDSEQFSYSSMVVDSIEVTANSTTLGEIQTRGTLQSGGQKIASFQQRFRLTRGNRVLQVELELDDLETPKSDPWNWYFASRYAFNDESSLISTTTNQTRQPAGNNRIEAPHYIDLETLKSRTSILTHGVPYHVRRGDRTIDSILIVRGETRRSFNFGIGIDLPNPLTYLAQPTLEPLVVHSKKRLKPDYSWFFHFDSKNVVATHWEPIVEENEPAGFRLRLLETMGRDSKFSLSCFRPIQSARRIRADHSLVNDLDVKDGKVSVHAAPNQFMEIEARW